MEDASCKRTARQAGRTPVVNVQRGRQGGRTPVVNVQRGRQGGRQL